MYTVLVCDDDKEIVEAIEIYLSQEGYRILKAYDGEQALKVLNEEKVDLLVIDDFGLMDLDLDKCRALFEVLDTRDGRKSTVVISQFPVSTWFDMFADNTYADACLIRITDKHHTYRLEMNGINMRETE